MVSAPLSLFPIEIATLGFGIYRMIASDMAYEKIIGLLATLLHLKRFYDHSGKIMSVSLKEWKWSLFITLVMVFILYNILSLKKSILVFALIAGAMQILGYMIAYRHVKFQWIFSYDIPIMLSSAFIGYTLYNQGNHWASIWFSDVIYHMWEFM